MVLHALKCYPATRKADPNLILAVYALIDRDVVNKSFQDVIKLAISDKRFPSFETIRRTRQKLQALDPSLKDMVVAKKREGKMQDSYKEYALS